jgi:diacylglycerol kinase family enzyme
VRALLIVNPRATSTDALRREVIVRTLASAAELDVVETRYRGHAAALAEAAAADSRDVVLTLGGDGTVNEAVNGLLSADRHDGGRSAAHLPLLAPLPGGAANVFVRALGFPDDPVDAAGRIIRSLAERRHRTIGLGRAAERYFTFSAGLGLDAEVVRAVEGARARGLAVTPALYVRTAVRQYLRVTDKRRPALTLERPGQPPAGPLFFSIVSNTAPWTYLGARAVHTSPLAGFDSGIDVFGLTSLRLHTVLAALRQMLAGRPRPISSRGSFTLHDQAEVTLRASRPIAFQVDGEYMGERESVRFRAVPHAVRVPA